MESGTNLPGSMFMNTFTSFMKKNRTPTQNDVESGSSLPLVPRPTASQKLKDLYSTIHGRGHRDLDKHDAVVYTKLMDHLDYIERQRSNLWCTVTRMAAEVLLVGGLTALLVSSLALDRLNRRRALEMRWWQWITMAMMIFAGFPVVKFVSWVVLWPVTWWWRISKLAVYFVRRLKRTMDVTVWFCLVLLGWYAWFRPRLNHVRGDVSAIAAHQITRFMIALCLGSFMWLLKDILYMKLEADLHYRQLFDRIKRTIVNLNGLVVVDEEVPPCPFMTYNTDQKWYERIPGTAAPTRDQVTNIWMDVYRMDKHTVPIWILRRLEKEYLKWIKINRPSYVDEFLQNDEALLTRAKDLFKSITSTPKIDPFEEITREQLKALGHTAAKLQNDKKLSVNEGMKLSKQELDFLFEQRCGEEEKVITHDEFLNWAVRAHKSSWGLERTLRSSKLALIKLNRLLSTFLLAVVLIIYLILTKIVTTAQLALLFAPFLAASFVFENSLKNMFQGLIFVFAMHPFDVGDRVVINDAQLRVKELNILTSVFFKYDTGSDVIYPNSKLVTMKIVNLDITPDQSDKLDFVVRADTPPEDVKDLELKIQKYMDEQTTFSSGTKVVKCTDCSFNSTEPLKMIVHFKYLVSYLTADKKSEHKSTILNDIIRFRKQMEANKKEYSHEHKPYHLIFVLNRAELIDGIEDMKKKILRCQIVKDHFPDSKVVIAALENKKVTIALYVRRTETDTQKEKDYFKDLSEQLSEEGIKHATELRVEKCGKEIYKEGFLYCMLKPRHPWDRAKARVDDHTVKMQTDGGGDSSTQEIKSDDS